MITIKLFGMVKSLADNQAEVVLREDGTRTVKDLIARLDATYPRIGELLRNKRVLISVNQDIAHEDLEIKDGDEVALLPPFAGGVPMSGERGTTKRESEREAAPADESQLVRVQRENFSIDAELDRVRRRSSRIGGITVFLGTARDHSRGHDVSSITFEYYEGMAQKKLREIRERALKDFDVLEILIVHRYGEIRIGENIVLIIAGAEHRADAFKACKW